VTAVTAEFFREIKNPLIVIVVEGAAGASCIVEPDWQRGGEG
jgi:hypothetical protein